MALRTDRTDERDRPAPGRLATAWALAGLTLVAAALRAFRLDLQSLWNDELASWHQAHWPTLAQVLERGVVPDVHPPGYFLLLHVWMRVAGASEAALRAPSVVFGVLTVPALFALGRSLYSRREALVAAALASVAWMPVYYSREARPYALLILCAVLTTWLLVEAVRRLETEGRLDPRFAAGYLLAAAVAAYSHYFGLLLVGLQAVVAGLRLLGRPRALLRLTGCYALLALAYVPWLPHLLEDLRVRSFWIKTPSPRALVELYRFELGRWNLLALVVLALLATALVRWIVEERGTPVGTMLRRALLSPTALLVLWLAAPPLVAWVKSQVSTPVFTLRNLAFTAPALYLLTARAVTRLARRGTATVAVTAALCVLLLADLGIRRRFWTRVTKEQWREAVARVRRDERFSDAPIFAATLDPAYFDYYLRRAPDEDPAPAVRLLVSGRDVTPFERGLADSGATHFWFLQIHRKAAPSLRRHLERHHRLLDEDDLVGAQVQLFAVGPDGG
ncbi:MAG: glycosyltransferase family 39 protein [Thermoanaerobaculia bacterium]